MTAYTHAGGIVARETGGKRDYLLVKARRTSDWVFPKGHIEAGESPGQAAVREVAEEAGVLAAVVGVAGSSRFYNGRERVVVSWFLMRYLGEARSDERRDVCWCPYDAAQQLLKHDNLRKALATAEQLAMQASRSPRGDAGDPS